MKAPLTSYVIEHTERGECCCGKCADRGNAPDPTGHTADLGFFKVAKRGEPDADRLRTLTAEHSGVFTSCNPLDGLPHDFTEVGAWIGDQGLAMQYMALAELLGVGCVILSPTPVLVARKL